jgi:DNA-binding transcriptional regulator YhcF (GntR family)
MTELTIVTDDPTPPYEQLRRQLTEMIRYGVLAEGDRLPPLRQLAADLGLAVGTVARAYRELEAAGLVTSRRGGGTRVARVPRTAPGRLLAEQAAAFVREARFLGADDAGILGAVRKALG